MSASVCPVQGVKENAVRVPVRVHVTAPFHSNEERRFNENFNNKKETWKIIQPRAKNDRNLQSNPKNLNHLINNIINDVWWLFL